MTRRIRRSTLPFLAPLAGLSLSLAAPAQAQAPDSLWRNARVPKFQRISTFEVARKTTVELDGLQVAADPIEEETVAEIVATNASGTTLVYTDGKRGAIGFVDITDPYNPLPDGEILTRELADVGIGPSEPTSVAVLGPYVLVAINTSQDFINPSGYLAVIDTETRQIETTLELGGQPDSVAVDPSGRYIAVVLENERNEDAEDLPEMPQLPSGNLVALTVDPSQPASSWFGPADGPACVGSESGSNPNVRCVALAGVPEQFPTDAEPEFVDINARGQAVITLQENNHLAIYDFTQNAITASFSAGEVALSQVDTEKDKNIDPSGSIEARPREPDAVTWIDNKHFATANEGDLNGGTRGFSVFNVNGTVRYDSGNRFEHLAISAGHFPDKRAGKKGTEPEGIESGTFSGRKLLFVGSERGNFVAVYRVRPGQRMQFVQMLPSAGVGPEGLLAIPQRKLFVIANEKDDGPGEFRSTISIFRQGFRTRSRAEYPEIASASVDGAPIGWSALSGLTADPFSFRNWRTLWAVSDSAIAPASIYRINARRHPAKIVSRTVVTQDGEPLNIDLEGIARRRRNGFWLAAEGKAAGEGQTLVNELVRVNNAGEVQERVELPADLAARGLKFGLEGVAVSYARSGVELVTTVIQREWPVDANNPTGNTLIGRYNTQNGSWTFFAYPLEVPVQGWVGLSEITHLYGNHFAVIERDNQQGPDAAIKRVYGVTLDMPAPNSGLGTALNPAPLAGPKTLLMDLLPTLKARRGWVPDKVEGMAVDLFGRFTFVSDNDGLDDAVGETAFWSTYGGLFPW